MTRSYEQMVDNAMVQLQQAVNQGKRPEQCEFRCTHAERLILNMQQLPDRWLAQSADRDMLCGLRIVERRE